MTGWGRGGGGGGDGGGGGGGSGGNEINYCTLNCEFKFQLYNPSAAVQSI